MNTYRVTHNLWVEDSKVEVKLPCQINLIGDDAEKAGDYLDFGPKIVRKARGMNVNGLEQFSYTERAEDGTRVEYKKIGSREIVNVYYPGKRIVKIEEKEKKYERQKYLPAFEAYDEDNNQIGYVICTKGTWDGDYKLVETDVVIDPWACRDAAELVWDDVGQVIYPFYWPIWRDYSGVGDDDGPWGYGLGENCSDESPYKSDDKPKYITLGKYKGRTVKEVVCHTEKTTSIYNDECYESIVDIGASYTSEPSRLVSDIVCCSMNECWTLVVWWIRGFEQHNYSDDYVKVMFEHQEVTQIRTLYVSFMEASGLAGPPYHESGTSLCYPDGCSTPPTDKAYCNETGMYYYLEEYADSCPPCITDGYSWADPSLYGTASFYPTPCLMSTRIDYSDDYHVHSYEDSFSNFLDFNNNAALFLTKESFAYHLYTVNGLSIEEYASTGYMWNQSTPISRSHQYDAEVFTERLLVDNVVYDLHTGIDTYDYIAEASVRYYKLKGKTYVLGCSDIVFNDDSDQEFYEYIQFKDGAVNHNVHFPCIRVGGSHGYWGHLIPDVKISDGRSVYGKGQYRLVKLIGE